MASVTKVLQIAAREIGYKESPSTSNRNKFGRWYGMDEQPWCAMFVSYCFYNAGLPLPITTRKGFAYCPYGVKWFKEQNKFFSTPVVGDVVFYDWEKDGISDHVGIVERINPDKSIVAIEGNTAVGNDSNGGEVMRRTRQKSQIIGFGRPDYRDDGPSSGPIPTHPIWSGRYITLTTPYMQGSDILTWQMQMINRGWDLGLSGSTGKGDDGTFGERSYEVLVLFQKEKGLEVDGVLGPQSWDAAWLLPITP